MNPPASVVAVAAVQFLGSLPFLFVSGGTLWAVVRGYRLYPHSHQVLTPAFWVVYIAVPICLSLLALVSSIGLLRQREWARRITLFLSVIPVSGCLLLVILRPPSVFPPDSGQGALLAVGGGIYLLMFVYLLVVLVPVSVWWLVLFSRESVRSQFH